MVHLFLRSGVLAWACLVLLLPALPASGANPAPRIVVAAMVDADRDDRADAVRLTYSERVWHARDTDGRYPFRVGTYGIRAVDAARGTRTLTVQLRERTSKDIGARPAVAYRSTTSRPVRDGAGRQAVEQTFRKTAPLDRDGDGHAARDCRPTDAAVHPGATDAPDLRFRDTNCDRVDGDERRAIFLSPGGDDAAPGTRVAPMRTVAAALDRAGTTEVDDDLYLAAGDYPAASTLQLQDGSGLFGGYAADFRSRGLTSRILGHQSALSATSVAGVKLQLLEVHAAPGAGLWPTSTGLTLRMGSSVALEAVTLRAGAGAQGRAGWVGTHGAAGASGPPGMAGTCDAGPGAGGGVVGSGVQAGGAGGRGGQTGANAGQPGSIGAGGAFGGGLGGAGGSGGNPGRPGTAGGVGRVGDRGVDGAARGGAWTSSGWYEGYGEYGGTGTAGRGGGGGGGGGGQGGILVDDGGGNGGGGGGQGGFPGQGAAGGGGGGASLAAYVSGSSLRIVRSTIVAAAGGRGGDGAMGGFGGRGGPGGPGGTACTGEIGAGGWGGAGGDGGAGGASGAGHGGPSVAVVSYDATVDTDSATTLEHGNPGAGGASPAAGAASDGAPGLAATLYVVPDA